MRVLLIGLALATTTDAHAQLCTYQGRVPQYVACIAQQAWDALTWAEDNAERLDELLDESAMVSARSFGAVGDGIHDDTAALQAALDSHRLVHLPPGNYRITSELVFDADNHLMGTGVPRELYPGVPSLTWDPTRHSFITYDGPVDVDAAALRVSAYPVGVEPIGTQNNAENVRLESIGVDCNDRCGIGVYFVRPQGRFESLHVKGSRAHAYVFMNIGGVTFTDLNAYRNSGAGFSLGRNIWNWSRLFADESVFVRPLALFNGSAGFDDSADDGTVEAAGYGIGVFRSRGLTFVGYESSWNTGPGIWFENEGGGGILFSGGYSEFNGGSGEWGLWYRGTADTINQRNLRILDVAFRDNIRLTGVQPARPSAGPIFEGLGYLQVVDADWSRYGVLDSNESMSFPRQGPRASLGHHGNHPMFGAIGVGQFNATTGTIVGEGHAGIIGGVDHLSTGRYRVRFAPGVTIPPESYSVQITTGANRSAGLVLKEADAFTFENWAAGVGAVDSNGLINYQVVRFVP